MQDHTSVPTEDDVQSLVEKLVDFDATLPPGQRSLFRTRVYASIFDNDDVEAHGWEMRWEAGAAGIFRQWVWVDDSRSKQPSKQQTR